MATNNSINLATPTSSTLVVSQTSGALAINTPSVLQTDTGIATWSGAGSYFDDTTLGSFTILRGGTGYIKGVPVTWAAPQTVTGLTAGNTYYIYIDSDGTLQKATARTDALFENYICLFECLRGSTSPTNLQFTVREDHPYNYPVAASNWAHDVFGPIIENYQNGANIALNGTVKIQINGTDVMTDHGLDTTIPDSGGVAVTWHKMYTNAAGKWAHQNINDTFAGYYNAAGTPTVLTVNRFGVYRLYVSKDSLNSSLPTYFSVLDTAQYTNIGNARTAISTGTVAAATNELAQLELAQLGFIIFSQASNSIVEVTISKSTARSTISSSGTNNAALINVSTTTFDGMLSATDTTSQTCFNAIDDYGKTPKASGDTGGVLSTTGITNVTDVSANSTGVFTIKSKTANNADSVGFIKIYIGTTPYYIAVFSTPTP